MPESLRTWLTDASSAATNPGVVIMDMTSNRPYLIRAFYDWIVDNGCTPNLVVDALVRGVEVPQSYVADGQIVLNIAPRAVTRFAMDNDGISFNTRFGGLPTDVKIPSGAVIGIYARENGQGMAFQADENPEPPPAVGSPPVTGGDTKRRLRVVK
tara:strand:+ start:25231 stop:25695 length:465 start_codon:yes stop_codon:yes gene_type:complete